MIAGMLFGTLAGVIVGVLVLAAGEAIRRWWEREEDEVQP